jgi:hypothetical protein
MALPTIALGKFNPYEQIGAVHNDALKYFSKNPPTDYTLDGIIRVSSVSVLNSFKGKGNYDDAELLDLQGITGCAFNTLYLPDTSDPNFIPINVDAIIKAKDFNHVQASFVKALLLPSTPLDMNDYKSIVINIEGKILHSELTCDEQFPLLAATAVAKSSIDYWKKEIKDPKTPWPPPVALRKFWKYLIADAAGALMGAAGGPIGAAGGAAGATILYALDK